MVIIETYKTTKTRIFKKSVFYMLSGTHHPQYRERYLIVNHVYLRSPLFDLELKPFFQHQYQSLRSTKLPRQKPAKRLSSICCLVHTIPEKEKGTLQWTMCTFVVCYLIQNCSHFLSTNSDHWHLQYYRDLLIFNCNMLLIYTN